MSISWGKEQRFKFFGAGSLNAWSPPVIPAVYAITYKQDELNKPKSHTVLYFGQADDLSQCARSSNINVVDSWTNSGGHTDELHVFIHPMPGSTIMDRMKVHELLVSEYRPQCNRILV